MVPGRQSQRYLWNQGSRGPSPAPASQLLRRSQTGAWGGQGRSDGAAGVPRSWNQRGLQNPKHSTGSQWWNSAFLFYTNMTPNFSMGVISSCSYPGASHLHTKAYTFVVADILLPYDFGLMVTRQRPSPPRPVCPRIFQLSSHWKLFSSPRISWFGCTGTSILCGQFFFIW